MTQKTSRSQPERRLRLPVRRVEDRWELEFGGEIPVAESQTVEMLVPKSAITDPEFLKAMTKQTCIKILDQGTPLRVMLATKYLKDVSDDARKVLSEAPHWQKGNFMHKSKRWSSGGISYFEITLGPPTERQAQDPDMNEGGLWLIVKGRKAEEIRSSTFQLPEVISKEPADSLNHALTLLSEAYEPWRKSHTGNVYDRIFYKESAPGGYWYPLSTLRDASLADADHAIARKLWQAFLSRVSSSGGN